MTESSVKLCPLAQQECAGEPCINFHWEFGGPLNEKMYFTMKYGFCSYFKKKTGHQEEVE